MEVDEEGTTGLLAKNCNGEDVMELILAFVAGAISGGVASVFSYQRVMKWLEKHSVKDV
jgi:hypothetical protein